MLFCPLFSGSSGNSSYIEAGDTHILIDAGLTGKAITEALGQLKADPCYINAILITHEHTDHINAAGVLSRRYDIPIYANAGTWQAMLPLLGNISRKNIRVFETERDFYINDVNITPFKTPHDSKESVGYSLQYHGIKLSFMTDIGHINEYLLCAVENSDLLLIEANHDVELLKAGPYPYHLKRRILSDTGHLSNENAGKALAKLYNRGVCSALLGHLSHENNFEQLAMETVRSVLRENDIPDQCFNLAMTHRNRIGGIYEIE
ncbi:MAG: MBL fold metallo-hydrolase [Clostridia bacterium]|nr:MBL fold metallo-hydrolase [Clostridia bacterium]